MKTVEVSKVGTQYINVIRAIWRAGIFSLADAKRFIDSVRAGATMTVRTANRKADKAARMLAETDAEFAVVEA